MGVTRQAPRWLVWLLAGGLALVFLGERILVDTSTPRLLATGLGTILVLVAAAWRVASWRRARETSTPQAATVEGRLALVYAGAVLALILYFVSTGTAIHLLGLDFADAAARGHYHTVLQVLWVIVVSISLLPALVAGLAPGARGEEGTGGLLEAARVGDALNTGLVIALAGVFLFLAGFVATRQDRSVDLGYFRTSRPGTATIALVRGLNGPLQVALFFPDASPVKSQLEDYFRELDRATGGKVHVEAHDPLLDPDAARRFDVGANGMVVLEGNGTKQGWPVPPDMERARPLLRTADEQVQYRLTRLVRGVRVAYLTVGHGELNDTTAMATATNEGQRLGGVKALTLLLQVLNYKVQYLGLKSGLGQDVPADAGLVLVLGPRRSFLPEELASLDRYVARGGSLLLALEPHSTFQLGALGQRLGVRFDPAPVVDDQAYVRRSGDLSDRGLLVTNAFAYHPAVKTAVVSDTNSVALFPDPAHLELGDTSTVHPYVFVRTGPTAFLDRNGDFQRDGPGETRGPFDLGVAVQVDSARVLVYADAEMFTDAVLSSLRVNASLASDAIRWLGREEAYAGTTVSEKDVPIEHTRAQDVAWFYSTILGAPALVLLLGLVGVHRRRRSGRAT